MAKFKVGDSVKHTRYGYGTITKLAGPGGGDPNISYHANFSGSVHYVLEKELKEVDPLKAGFQNGRNRAEAYLNQKMAAAGIRVENGKKFTFEGKQGSIDDAGFVTWGGNGFQVDAAKPALRKAIKEQTGK